MRLNFLSRITAAALALLFVLALAVPMRFAAKAKTVEPSWTVPGGYNEQNTNPSPLSPRTSLLVTILIVNYYLNSSEITQYQKNNA